MFICAISAAGVFLVLFPALLDNTSNFHRDFRLSLRQLPWPTGFLPCKHDCDVCVGANASLGEVEDILCMVRYLPYTMFSCLHNDFC